MTYNYPCSVDIIHIYGDGISWPYSLKVSEVYMNYDHFIRIHLISNDKKYTNDKQVKNKGKQVNNLLYQLLL